MKQNGAKTIDVTNSKPTLKYGKFELTLLNTDKGTERKENYNSIGILVKSGKVKVFLSADIENPDNHKIMSQIGKVDVLKMNHHGYSGHSIKYLNTLKPDAVVISNNMIWNKTYPAIAYLQEKYNTSVYYTGSVSSAIKLYISNNTYRFENAGTKVNLTKTGWEEWPENNVYLYNDWVYLENGKLFKGWLNDKNKWYYLDNDGLMLVGFRLLKWSGGTNWFYFDKINGDMYHDQCTQIDGKNYCFNQNGVCYSGC